MNFASVGTEGRRSPSLVKRPSRSRYSCSRGIFDSRRPICRATMRAKGSFSRPAATRIALASRSPCRRKRSRAARASCFAAFRNVACFTALTVPGLAFRASFCAAPWTLCLRGAYDVPDRMSVWPLLGLESRLAFNPLLRLRFGRGASAFTAGLTICRLDVNPATATDAAR